MIDKEYDDNTLEITEEFWKSYSENVLGAIEYVQATIHMVRKIDEVLENSASLSDLQMRLEALRNEKKSFIISACKTL